MTCETEDPKWICDTVYVLDDEKEDDRIFIVQMRNLSLLAIRLFGDDEKLVAEALPFDESVPDDSVPTVAKPARASGTGTARAPSTNTSTSSRWPSTPWPAQWVWTPHGWYRNW